MLVLRLLFTNPYGNEKSDGQQNSTCAISQEFAKGLVSTTGGRVTVCYTFVSH